ncbi:hypothetical protein [Sinisalibacter aestuarii]|uniref:General stress protein 17M-like domain-containing protein n=1 Tax=Sinisalibacter aestuarii TaxID=2949426 RepID=A0ABQ5LZ01_9RHOB|nr:hypothetical protein [Sinisalibacter aestuarii]GKY90199.1 hypothetical protein STA1M1_40680 [Sinisalibacter aestuarii]
MSNQTNQTYTIREVVAVFHDAARLEAAVDALEGAGFVQTNISIMADSQTVADKLGHRFEPIEEMEEDPKIPRRTFVGKADRGVEESAAIGLPLYVGAMAGSAAVVASGGAVAMALLAAAAGGAIGGGLGGILARGIGKAEADRLEDNIRHGGILLWVAVGDADAERVAIDVLGRHGGTDVHVHEIEPSWEEPEIPFDQWNPDPFLLRA